MFVKYILRNFKQPKILYRPSLRYFATTPEQETKEQNNNKPKQLHIVVTPKRIFAGIICVSWIFLLKYWFDAEERTRKRAEEYYEKGGSVDESLPEEYRKEYVKISLFMS